MRFFTISSLLLLAACTGDPSTGKDSGGTTIGKDDGDLDGFTIDDGDCDDADPSVNPAATEICDGVDNNCDGTADEGVTSEYWEDADEDGFGNPDVSLSACEALEGYVANSNDCDDTNGASYPGNTEICDDIDNDCDGSIDEDVAPTWYMDKDTDGYGDDAASTTACDAPDGYVATGGDCDDTNAGAFPGNTEICDDADNDCDGAVDEGLAYTWYQDSDADGYGWEDSTTTACTQPEGYVENDDDCDDTNVAVNPAASEVCNDIDDNCDGVIDTDAIDATTWYIDTDGDSFGVSTSYDQLSCDQPAGYVADSTDCDDTNDDVNPAATELCNGYDDDCNGSIDEGTTGLNNWYGDTDADGYGDPDDRIQSCDQPAGYIADDSDCDDNDPTVNMGATETCDGVDDDCNGYVDDDATDAFTQYEDLDGDTFGNPDVVYLTCDLVDGWVSNSSDCNDEDFLIYPGAEELCNGFDDDCNGIADDGADGAAQYYADADSDSYGDPDSTMYSCEYLTGYVENADDCDDAAASTYPGATEYCNGVDDDCDVEVDEDTVDTLTWYYDGDTDGYGSTTDTYESCLQPDGFVNNTDDCDDTNSDINPGEAEICNEIDDDCDGSVDNDAEDGYYLYYDGDADGYGDPATLLITCDESFPSSDYVAEEGDCDDTDAALNPGAAEYCDGVDEDCNGVVDDGAVDASNWYADVDTDNYGDYTVSTSACDAPDGYVADDTDCNDNDATITPADACDWVSYSNVPGGAVLYIASESNNTIIVDDDGVTSSVSIQAGEAYGPVVLSGGTLGLSGDEPFVAHVAVDDTGIDMAATFRSLVGSYRSDVLVGWAGDSIVITNPQSTTATVSVDVWSGSAWSSVSTATVDAESTEVVSVSGGYYRLTGDTEILGMGFYIDNEVNHFEYLTATDGDRAGITYLWTVPEYEGAPAMTGQCTESVGCTVEVYENGSLYSSHSVSYGETWYDYVVASRVYEVIASAPILLRDEATPDGFDAADGTSLDADFVPSTTGDLVDTEFLVASSLGNATSDTSRRSDIHLVGYEDNTIITVEQMLGTAWSSLGTVTVDQGEVFAWATNEASDHVFRFTSGTEFSVQLTHGTDEFAFSIYGGYFRDGM